MPSSWMLWLILTTAKLSSVTGILRLLWASKSMAFPRAKFASGSSLRFGGYGKRQASVTPCPDAESTAPMCMSSPRPRLMTPVLSPIHGGHVSGTLRSYMKNLSDNWEELRLKVLGVGDSSVSKPHYPNLRKRLAELEQIRSKLQQSEAYLAEAQRLSHTGSFGWYVSSGEIFWSDETYRIFEYDRSVKPTIDSVVQRVHPQDRADFQKVMDGASRGATDFEHTYRLLLPDGRTKHIHALAHALADASGNREFVGAAIDVTSIKRAEEELHKSEFYLAEGQRLAHTGSWAFNAAGFEYWSSELFRIYGLDPSGKPPTVEEYLNLMHPEDREFMEQGIQKILADHRQFDFTKRIVRPDGKTRFVRCVGVPRTHGETFLGFVGTGMDVTEQEQLTQELQRREAYLAEAQRLSQTGSWAWSPDQDTRYWSEECYRILSFDPQDGLPRFEQFFQRIHPDDQPGFRALFQTAIREKAERQSANLILQQNVLAMGLYLVSHPALSSSSH